MKQINRVLSLILLCVIFVPLPASTATVYFDPQSGSVSPQQMFSVNIRVDNEDECVNAFDITLTYPSDIVEVVTVSRGRSILTLWIEDPVIDHSAGEVSFIGGVPGGYCGRVPGDPDLTNVLATLIFQPVNGLGDASEVSLEFSSDSSVLISDGVGSEAELDLRAVTYEVGDIATVNASEWLDILREDRRPPEGFDIELMQDDSVFGGQYFIVFSTTDKESGLSHFEIKEEDIDREGYVRQSDTPSQFKRASSPYVLEDQTLNSVITVKAVDHAGNERVARYVPDQSMRHDDSGTLTIFSNILAGITPLTVPHIVVLVLLVALLITGITLFHRRSRRTGEREEEVFIKNSQEEGGDKFNDSHESQE